MQEKTKTKKEIKKEIKKEVLEEEYFIKMLPMIKEDIVEMRNMSATFFSAFSNKMSHTRFVNLLNKYIDDEDTEIIL